MDARPTLVGITGGIGSGKSTICKVFESLGVPVYDADAAAKRIMHQDKSLIQALKEAFGEETYLNGVLNREYLGKKVFNNPDQLAQLNALTHPAVGKDFEQWVSAHNKASYVVKEAALLIESGMHKQLDFLLLVTAPESVRIERVVKRDTHRTAQDVALVIQRQMPEEEKKKHCQLVLENDGLQPVLPTVLELHQKFGKVSRP